MSGENVHLEHGVGRVVVPSAPAAMNFPVSPGTPTCTPSAGLSWSSAQRPSVLAWAVVQNELPSCSCWGLYFLAWPWTWVITLHLSGSHWAADWSGYHHLPCTLWGGRYPCLCCGCPWLPACPLSWSTPVLATPWPVDSNTWYWMTFWLCFQEQEIHVQVSISKLSRWARILAFKAKELAMTLMRSTAD